MKEGARFEHSETVVKKKSSSGCLIIKKKIADSEGGVRGFSDPSSRSLFKPPNEKKRPRIVQSDSESSDGELSDPVRRKVDIYRNGSGVNKGIFLEKREFQTDKRVNNGLDILEYNERRIRKDVNDDRHRVKLYRQNGDQRESKGFHYDNKNTMFGAKSGRLTHGVRSRYEMENDESQLPRSQLNARYNAASDEPIRLQGRNGVLKVMVNKNKQLGVSRRSYDHVEAEDWKEPLVGPLNKKNLNASHKSGDHRGDGDEQGSKYEDAKVMAKSAFNSDSKSRGEKVASKSKVKGDPKLPKPTCSKGTNENHTPMQSTSCGALDVVKSEGTINTPTKNNTPVKGKETKVKRGSGTEKQLLREKIKNMLLGAGWTIDYRPRRNRDYLDAVYINPAGTAYWSIIKAYEALQKEEEDNSKAGGNFTPLPNEILGKLTRQTRKKIEREMKKKRKDEGSSRNAKRAKAKESADSNQEEGKPNSYMRHRGMSIKSRSEEASLDSGYSSSDNSYKGTPMHRIANTSVGTSSHKVQGRKSRKIGRCTLLVRSSDKGLNSGNDGFVPNTEKRTLFSWLIDSGTVHMSEKVQYMDCGKTRVMQEGRITRDGILCSCCGKILPVLKFKLHAGSKLYQPFQSIYIQSGRSLMQCQIDAWNKQGELERKGFHTVNVDGDDPSDDTCGLCGDGGDLICCDGCPSTFHQSCLDMQTLPPGDWHCPNCACKYCEIAGGNSPEANSETERRLLMCCLCEKKYHESCIPGMDTKQADSNYPNLSFCGKQCLELYDGLQKLLGFKHELDSGFSWSLLHRSDLSLDTSSVDFPQRVECNSMLAVALSIMDECFLPTIDRRSGINLIHNVVYNCGSNFSRINYNGFLTAILERDNEVLCAASIRIHGTQLAEMPFVGTRHVHRRQGMCRRLLSAIESALSSLHIEKLIIPAVAEHMHTWTDVFGFRPLEETQRQEIRSMNMVVFPGTDMLQKPLLPQGRTIGEGEGNKPLALKSGPNSLSVPLDDSSCVNASKVEEIGSDSPKARVVPCEHELRDVGPVDDVRFSTPNSEKVTDSVKLGDVEIEHTDNS